MKTFIIKIWVASVGTSRLVDPASDKRVKYWNAQGVTEWIRENYAETKQEFYDAIKPMLAKGGWIFDPLLWKWDINLPTAEQLSVWCTITFEGDGSESKEEFMKYVAMTGILQYGHIVIKNYS